MAFAALFPGIEIGCRRRTMEEGEEQSIDKLKDVKLKDLDGKEVTFSSLWKDKVPQLLVVS